jgi:hypothetical protein
MPSIFIVSIEWGNNLLIIEKKSGRQGFGTQFVENQLTGGLFMRYSCEKG